MTVIYCIDCPWFSSSPFPLCIEELAEHDCGGE